MIDDLSAAIIAWFDAQQPNSAGGVLRLNLLLFTDLLLTPEPLPLLRLSNLVLPISTIRPPLKSSPSTAANNEGVPK